MKLPGQQPALQQMRQPPGVGEICFAARHVLHMPGVAYQDLLEVPVLDQRVVDRHGIDPVASIATCVTPSETSQRAASPITP